MKVIRFYARPALEILSVEMLALALQNLHRAGSKRNRGFGELRCTMLQNDRNIQQVLIKNAWKRGSLA